MFKLIWSFVLFVNDLPDIFYSNCMPASFNNSKINCLMYADDVILLSETPTGFIIHSLPL
jgi:hypothetical protein